MIQSLGAAQHLDALIPNIANLGVGLVDNEAGAFEGAEEMGGWALGLVAVDFDPVMRRDSKYDGIHEG